jgi:hypothetical protein
MLELTRKMDFSASHRLWRGDWSDEQNRRVFGSAAGERVFGHTTRSRSHWRESSTRRPEC